MMNAHQLDHLASLSGQPARRLPAGQALALGRSGGRLQVLSGRVWLTQRGETEDVVVEAGRSLAVAASSGAVIEAWDDDRPVLVAWQPRRSAERIADAWNAAIALAARPFLHNAADAARPTGRRARQPAQETGRCPAGAA